VAVSENMHSFCYKWDRGEVISFAKVIFSSEHWSYWNFVLSSGSPPWYILFWLCRTLVC